MGDAQQPIDTRALEIASEAKAIAIETRDGVHRELEKFERTISSQHDRLAEKQETLRDLVSDKASQLHQKIDLAIKERNSWALNAQRGIIAILLAVSGFLAGKAFGWY